MTHTVLVSGANRGIGLEFVRQYADAGWQVYAACRSPENAAALNALAANYAGRVQVLPLDIGNSAHIRALADSLKGQAVDLLLNNAGVYGQNDANFGKVDEAKWMQTLHINTVAPLMLAQALVDNVASSEYKVIANLSSKMGSIEDNGSGGSYVYRSSKAALNMVMKSMAIDLSARGITVVNLHPGWVKTDMGGPNAQISVEQSVSGMKAVLAGLKPADSGLFFEYDGSVIPW